MGKRDMAVSITDLISKAAPGVYGFFGPYRWLSNFHLVPILYNGMEYQSTEAAYMAQKTLDMSIRKQLTVCTPKEAKQIGRSIELRRGWDVLKLGYMYEILKVKYKDPVLYDKLQGTKGLFLEETNTWGDRFWGVDGSGFNMLGHLTMSIRDHK